MMKLPIASFPFRKKILILSVFMLGMVAAFFAWSKKSKPDYVRVGAYYWRTQLQAEPASVSWMKLIGGERVYLRLFDVDWHPIHTATPLGEIRFNRYEDADQAFVKTWGKQTVPVVFLTNRLFIHLTPVEITTLADQVLAKITRTCNLEDWSDTTALFPYRELQFDCDWTASTRDKYFRFLELIRNKTGVVISATLRLSQVRDRLLMGVPPVDRLMLMAYNLEPVQETEVDNSILNTGLMGNYLKKQKPYPVPVDLALPLFQWAAVFTDARFKGIIREPKPENWSFATPEGRSGWYVVQRDTVIGRLLIRQGDRIRLESPDLGQLKEAARLAQPLLTKDTLNIVFFHLSPACLNRFPHDKIREVVNLLR